MVITQPRRDLIWNNHVTYIYKRANSRLHFLWQL